MTDYTEDKSRTEIKNEANDLQALGERLISLSNTQLSGIDIPEELKEAVQAAKTFTSHKAKRRQRQFIGALMRQIEPEPVIKAINAIEGGISLKSSKLGILKQLHKDLLSGNSTTIDAILSEHPEVDRQRLNQLVRNAKKEQSEVKKQKSAANLLKYLKEISS